MFDSLQNEVNGRMLTLKMHFRACCPDDRAQFATVSKGLVFVSLYGTHEHAVRGIVSAGRNALRAKAAAVKLLKPQLVALVLEPEISAAVSAGKRTAWMKRRDLFCSADSTGPINSADGAFPSDGSQYRVSQLETIWRLFDITGDLLPDPRLYPLVGEVVENRNKISHGNSTAEEVGRGYSLAEIESKISGMERIWSHLIGTIKAHCADRKNLCR